MDLLANWEIEHNGTLRTIELYRGDLSRLPDDQAVDLLVVSAFQNDYLPTLNSLIGALENAGISVARLAANKQFDLREDFSCWVSKRVPQPSNFQRLLCVESGWRGTPPEIADDVFRALVPASTLGISHRSIAMPLIGAGDQGYPADEILIAILKAALSWFRRGLDVRVLKIVTYSLEDSLRAQKAFLQVKTSSFIETTGHADALPENKPVDLNRKYDVFISYAHADLKAAMSICEHLEGTNPQLRIFIDRRVLHPGTSWLLEIADSLDNARLIVALYTPRYWSSKFCKDEFEAAWIRQKHVEHRLLFPIQFEESRIPWLFQTMQYQDCREADFGKLADASQCIEEMIRKSPEW